MTDQYTDVQFIGYAIPSIPRLLPDVSDPQGFIEGHYIGVEPAVADIFRRIELTMKAIEQTVKNCAVDCSPSTLKIFVMPEFSFRGKHGAYDNFPHVVDYFTVFRKEFARRVAVPAYKGWLFAAGTVVNTVEYVRGQDLGRDLKALVREEVAIALARAWRYSKENDDTELRDCLAAALRCYTDYCHKDPVYTVTDKSYVVAGGSPETDYCQGLSIEKKYVSNEDFVLNFYGYAEDECGYPKIGEQDGENKRTAFDALSIFTIQGIKFGLEICLDHLGRRLRRFRRPETEHVQIQLVPSCGVQQIDARAVIAGPDGLVFNCDGQFGEIQSIDPSPDPSQSIWTGAVSGLAHTQLAKVATACSDNLLGSDARLTGPGTTVTRLPIHDTAASRLFAYGAGEVHIYSRLPVPPPVPDDAAGLQP
jgi:hypothetical protein